MLAGRQLIASGTEVLLAREEPTREMHTAAATAGSYSSPGWGRAYPRIPILTVAELLRGATIQMPPAHGTFAQAPRATGPGAQQGTLGLE